MRIESLSIKTATTSIFVMIAIVAIVLSLFAGTYFRKSALDAQMISLSRVLEVAAQEMLFRARSHSQDLGMKLAHSPALVSAFREIRDGGSHATLQALLDDPFMTGFAGASSINLVRLRVYDLSLAYVAGNNNSEYAAETRLPAYFVKLINQRDRQNRLKAVDGLWQSAQGPLYSTIVPLGGLRQVGYLEVVINPVFNLPEIATMTGTSVSIYNVDGKLLNAVNLRDDAEYLPVEYILKTPAGEPSFRIVGLENVDTLNTEMMQTQVITISGFLLLAFATLLFALWLFNRFMLSPVSAMMKTMRMMARGNHDLSVNNRGLLEFNVLADTFNLMAEQVRMRTSDLESLLDLDDNAILCFDSDFEMVFFNRSAAGLFGYQKDEISDLSMAELFIEDITSLLSGGDTDKLHTILTCKNRDGHEFNSDAVVNVVDVMGQRGYAIALSTVDENTGRLSERDEQRFEAVERSLSNLLEFTGNDTVTTKAVTREQAVAVMNLALTCWQHILGKTKLELAEQSRIWPVYIDKSTPTTRTLDKYLNLNTCPKNPRHQRVIDTAEFVLREAGSDCQDACAELAGALENYRELLSGIRRH